MALPAEHSTCGLVHLTLHLPEWYDPQSFPLIFQKFLKGCGTVLSQLKDGIAGGRRATDFQRVLNRVMWRMSS